MAKAFKTWTAGGEPAPYHRTDVLNRASELHGRKGYDRAAFVVGSNERVSGVTANAALEFAGA